VQIAASVQPTRGISARFLWGAFSVAVLPIIRSSVRIGYRLIGSMHVSVHIASIKHCLVIISFRSSIYAKIYMLDNGYLVLKEYKQNNYSLWSEINVGNFVLA
jgi:hypothetical protein